MRGHPNLKTRTELNGETEVREKEVPMEENLRTYVVSPTLVVSRRCTRKEKGKGVVRKEVPPERDQVPSAGIRIMVYVEKPAKVLAVSSDTEEDPLAMEKVTKRVVEDIVGEAVAPQKVVSPRTSTGTVILETGKDPSAEEIQSQVLNAADVLCGHVQPLLQYLDLKREKYTGTTNNGSYVELVRYRMRAKVATTSAVAAKERQL